MARSRTAARRGIRRKALLVGINQYPCQPLKGCVNDALMVGNWLIDHFGFTPGADMRLVVDHRATREAIRNRLEWLVDGARAGDILVFQYAGHGSQVPCRSSDEVDQFDECIIPIDHDWDNPFRDDDLAEFVRMIPDGVNFTAIIDACHSGTMLRDFRRGPPTPVTPRYLVPPPDIAFRAVKEIDVTPGSDYFSVTMTSFRDLEKRGFGQVATDRGILVAGARSDQSAADAFIENDYHGALTYSLFKALAEGGPEQSYRQWVEMAARLLQDRFRLGDQEPQIECPSEMADWKLFTTETARTAAAGRRAVADKHVVYVHGIGEHQAGYSASWWESMCPYTPDLSADDCHEVVWSDLVNRISRTMAGPLPVEMEITQSIRDVLADRAQRQSMEVTAASTESERSYEDQGPRAFLGIPGLDNVDDFVRYLLSDAIRSQVIARFRDLVRPLLAKGAEVHVISHSWGTVVAYEALLQMEEDSSLADGGVASFFTVGSALSIPPVKRLLRPVDARGRKPRLVRRWINLDAKFDVVGGAIKGNPFNVDFEYLGLKPVGCGLMPSPACAHSSYFRPANRRVQEIFAEFINE